MSRKLQLFKELNPALQRISDMLVKSFNEIGEKIRADLLKGYRENAKHWFDKFVEASKTQTGRIIPSDYRERQFSHWSEWYRFADVDSKNKDAYSSFKKETWEDLRAPGVIMKVTYKYADQRAHESYENARDSFVHKNLEKIREVMGSRTDLKNSVILFEWKNNYFKGNLQVYLENAFFRGDLDIKYVVRTIPRVTPYFQYPLVFTDAEVGGKAYARPSELELRNLLSGKSSEQHEEEKKAAFIAAGFCTGSGKQVDSKVWAKIANRMSKYVKCPDCGQTVSAQHGKFRQHKTAAFEKQAEAKKLTDAGYCPMSKQPAPYQHIEKFIKSYKVWPGGVEKLEYDFDSWAPDGKRRSIMCDSCGRLVPINDSRGSWEGPEKVKAFYQKHKI